MPAEEKPADPSYSLPSNELQGIAFYRQFACMPPVNPRDRERQAPDGWSGLAGLAADVDYYARRMRDAALVASSGETSGVPAALAGLVRQSKPYIVHDQIDHYSTGSASPYATTERDVAAYADAIVGYLTLLVDTCARESATSADRREPEGWESQLGKLTRAIQALAT